MRIALREFDRIDRALHDSIGSNSPHVPASNGAPEQDQSRNELGRAVCSTGSDRYATELPTRMKALLHRACTFRLRTRRLARYRRRRRGLWDLSRSRKIGADRLHGRAVGDCDGWEGRSVGRDHGDRLA